MCASSFPVCTGVPSRRRPRTSRRSAPRRGARAVATTSPACTSRDGNERLNTPSAGARAADPPCGRRSHGDAGVRVGGAARDHAAQVVAAHGLTRVAVGPRGEARPQRHDPRVVNARADVPLGQNGVHQREGLEGSLQRASGSASTATPPAARWIPPPQRFSRTARECLPPPFASGMASQEADRAADAVGGGGHDHPKPARFSRTTRPWPVPRALDQDAHAPSLQTSMKTGPLIAAPIRMYMRHPAKLR